MLPLDPILEDDLLRVGGRFSQAETSWRYKHPVILPADHHITNLIIKRAHNNVYHQGRGFTMNRLRASGYWVIGGSKAVARMIRNCVVCRKLRRPTEIQQMSQLPPERVNVSAPFTYVGMDCFGPFATVQGRKQFKRYGLIFTCMCTRGVHIEMIDDMTSDAFINGLRCFIAVRGYVAEIRCDQGTNFIGASNELRKGVMSYLTEKHCQFVFNAPDASHTGGVWERQIRTVRNVFNGIMKLSPGRLDDASLRTLLYEVMSIVNSRPLSVKEIGNAGELEALTPNHIITTKAVIPMAPAGVFVKEDLMLRKRWRRVQFLLEQFWARWRKEYLAEISLRQKWHREQRNIMVGDIVLIKDIDLPRNQWPLAIVTEAKADGDNLVRRVKVRLGCKGGDQATTLERSIHKLVLILENDN